MRQGCANTLLNLGSDPGREIEITKCGAVSVLLITALVASDSDETRHACTKAMANLLCEKKVRGRCEPENGPRRTGDREKAARALTHPPTHPLTHPIAPFC